MFAKFISMVFILSLLLTACQLFVPPPIAQPTTEMVTPSPLPTDTSTAVIDPGTPTPTETLQPTPASAPLPDLPPEAIMILEPAFGSQVASPLRVRGSTDPTFEGTLFMNIIQDYDTVLPEISTTIRTVPGERGSFEFEYAFEHQGPALIQVYALSERDGGLTHLSHVGVELAPHGPADIQTTEPYVERITIFSPAPSETITSGAVTVEGFGWGWQLVEIEILGENGDVIGSGSAQIDWPDVGAPGPFRAVVPYFITHSQPGRVVVRDRSMAYAGFVHLNSVEVNFEMHPQLTEEAIMILEPAPESHVTSPLRVRGFADPTFEQNLLMRLVLEDGTVLPETFTIIRAGLGERGAFEFEYAFEHQGPALIQVYDVSARDGGIIHLSSVEVTLDPTGSPDIRTRDPYLERIAIGSPTPSQVVTGGVIEVSGVALRSHPPLLMIDLLDENGDELFSTDVEFIYAIGEHGTFWAQLEYSIDRPQPGRVVVRDPSWDFQADAHLTSVDFMLEP
ncbi:MAG: hypothetical protein IBX69_18555 [Anaerolineales bacterium]|nr:hypothetical protein [Anaerolineales bacterium]